MNVSEIKQQYPYLQKVSDHYAFEMYKNIMSEQIITEFLYTVHPEITAKQVVKQAGYGIYINHSENKITLTFDTLTKEYLDKVNKVMDKFGWYPSYIDNKNGGKYSTNIDNFIGKHEIVIEYEAKYDTQAKLDSKYLYHLTPDILYPKIKISGLTPKSQSKLSNHPERIYLLNPTDDDDMEEIAITLWNSISNNKLKDSIGDYYLLRIDTSKLPNHKFFEDPNFWMGNGAVWTYQNVSPSIISIDKLININPNPIISEGYEIADKRRNKFKENYDKTTVYKKRS
jgi:hypothetical protein